MCFMAGVESIGNLEKGLNGAWLRDLIVSCLMAFIF